MRLRTLSPQEPGKEGFAIQGDAGTESFAETAVSKVIEKFGKIDILVNNCAEQHTHQTITEITEQELEARGAGGASRRRRVARGILRLPLFCLFSVVVV